MSDKKALEPLKKTHQSLLQIKETLTPFLILLDQYHNQTSDLYKSSNNPTYSKQEIAEAEAAVSLAMGTLRYMAHRLKGEIKGKKKNDPLRMELDKMRKTLVQCKSLRKETKSSSSKSNVDPSVSASPSPGKRKRIDEESSTSASTATPKTSSSSNTTKSNKKTRTKKTKKGSK